MGWNRPLFFACAAECCDPRPLFRALHTDRGERKDDLRALARKLRDSSRPKSCVQNVRSDHGSLVRDTGEITREFQVAGGEGARLRSGSIVWRWGTGLLLVVCCVARGDPSPTGGGTAQPALDEALAGTNAVAVVLDEDGRLIAVERREEAERRAKRPGSTLKPFFLQAALRQGRVGAETTVVCHGDLRIAGRDVACTHPREENVLDAERALAYSCNAWFANLGRRFTPEDAAEVLRRFGFGSRTDGFAEEAAGEVRTPRTDAEVQLLVLGLEGVQVTTVQLARGYWQLGRELDREPVVRRGLEGSVAYGMAHNAATERWTIAGKTGTASDAGEAWTHGWFAGIARQSAKQAVVVIDLPRGNGADAATLAHRFFAAWERRP